MQLLCHCCCCHSHHCYHSYRCHHRCHCRCQVTPSVWLCSTFQIFLKLYCRYGWDDQFYEYDDTGQYEYEGWFQDEYGEWHQDPVYKEYYENLEKSKSDPNNSASKNDQKTDNSSGPSAFRNLKESVTGSNKDDSVNDLNKKNIENIHEKASDNYYIPYGEEYGHDGWYQNEVGEWLQDPSFSQDFRDQHVAQSSNHSNKVNNSQSASKGVSKPVEKEKESSISGITSLFKSKDSGKSSTIPACNGAISASKNNATENKTMPTHITSRPKPPDYEEAWYEEPSDGQWYNSYDWYEDENGEWAYDYRMEEYGYVQNEHGEWVPGEGADIQEMGGQPQLQRVPSSQHDTQQTTAASKPPEDTSSKGFKELSSFSSGLFGAAKETASNATIAVDNVVAVADSVMEKATDAVPINSKANGFLPQEGINDKSNNINGEPISTKREASKDGFSRLFSCDKPEESEQAIQKSSLPPRPPDYDDYWYQAEDGNWYNEYDDMGYQFADEEILLIEENDKAELQTVTHVALIDQNKAVTDAHAKNSTSSNNSDTKLFNQLVPNSKSDIQTKKQPKPIDYDDYWYQDEAGSWRNEYDDMGYEFDDEDSFYTEEELEKEEAKMLRADKEVTDGQSNRSKTDSKKAVELKESVINVSKISEEVVSKVTKEVFKNNTDAVMKEPVSTHNNQSTLEKPKKKPRPTDYDDMWYQDYDGNWFNEYDHDGNEYDDDIPPDTVSFGDKETPLKKNKKNVSFEKSDASTKEKVSTRIGRSPRERWQWAFARIVQVGK